MTREQTIKFLRQSMFLRSRDVFDIVCANAADILGSDKHMISSLTIANESMKAKLENMPHWTRINSRRKAPDPNQRVLLLTTKGDIYVGYLLGKKKKWGYGKLAFGDCSQEITGITHWRNLIGLRKQQVE